MEVDIRKLATGEDAACEACRGDGGFNERAKVAATLELILDPEAALATQSSGPLGVDLALEVKSTLLVGDVTRSTNEGKADPEEKSVPGEEAAVVEQDTSPAN